MTASPMPILQAGAPLAKAGRALVLLHGRGGNAEELIELGRELTGDDWALLAPQAPGHTWYPLSFLAPREENEPYLTRSLSEVQRALAMANNSGVPTEKVAFCGFSQGACLATEFVGLNPQRYAGLIAYTGGLIGPLDKPIQLAGDLAGTPILLSSGDPDPHVPWKRVQESAELLRSIGGQVTVRRYAGRPHTVLPGEVEDGRNLLGDVG